MMTTLENKLDLKLTIRVEYQTNSLYDAIVKIREASVTMNKYLINIKKDSNNNVETELLISLLNTITITPSKIEDLCFPESLMLDSDGLDFYDSDGILFSYRKYKNKYIIWFLLPSKEWKEPGVAESLYERMANILCQ